MSISSDLIEESSISQIIYDANKSSSLLLSGPEIVLSGLNENVIKLNALGINYNNETTTWETIANNNVILDSLINASTFNVTNTLQIQNSQDSPTKTITISCDESGNRIAINGDYGQPNNILISGGSDSNIQWGSGGGGSVGNLGEVLNNGNKAFKNINMNNNSIFNISSISITTPPLSMPSLTDSRLTFPITIDGELYYIPLFKISPQRHFH